MAGREYGSRVRVVGMDLSPLYGRAATIISATKKWGKVAYYIELDEPVTWSDGVVGKAARVFARNLRSISSRQPD